MIFFSCWATYIQIFFGNIHNIVTTTVTNSTNVEPVSYIYIIKPTGCQNNPGRVFPFDASASIPVLVDWLTRENLGVNKWKSDLALNIGVTTLQSWAKSSIWFSPVLLLNVLQLNHKKNFKAHSSHQFTLLCFCWYFYDITHWPLWDLK